MKLKSERFDVFAEQARALVQTVAKKGDSAPARLCLLNLVSHVCPLLPLEAGTSPDYVALNQSASRLALLSDKTLVLVDLNGVPVISAKMSSERLGSPFLYTRFLNGRPELFVTGVDGTAVLWTPQTNKITRLPTTYAPLASASGAESWMSPDGEWLIVRDLLRAVTGYRIGKATPEAQRLYPVQLPFEAGNRAATLGGGLTETPDGHSVAFGDTSTNAVIVLVEKSSLATFVRKLAGHDSPVTSISFSADGRYIFTADLKGHLRVWPAGAEAFSAVPTVLPVDPENRVVIPDSGNFGEIGSVSLSVTGTIPPVLVVGANFGLGAYDVLDPADGGLAARRRSLRFGDLPQFATPNSTLMEEIRKHIKGVSFDSSWEVAAFYGGRVAIVFGDGVRIFRQNTPKGRALTDSAGRPLKMAPNGVASVASNVFAFNDYGSLCRIEVGISSERIICAKSMGKPPSDLKDALTVVPISDERFLLDYHRLLIVDWSSNTYKIKRLNFGPKFCGESGTSLPSRRFSYFICDKEVIVYDLLADDPSPMTLRFDDVVTAIHFELSQGQSTVLVGDNAGGLRISSLSKSRVNGALFSKLIAKGHLSSRSRINAVLLAGLDAPVTADGNGQIWRWQKLKARKSGRQEIVLAVRLAQHNGSVLKLKTLMAPGTGDHWVVSAGADGKVLLSPIGIAPLLRAAQRVRP